MKVALHSVPDEFFKSDPPHSNSELLRLVRKADSWGFKAFEVGPMWSFGEIDSKSLKNILDAYSMERSVHVGGRYDAVKFAKSDDEYNKAQDELKCGIELCRGLASGLVSFHPPFFTANDARDKRLLSEAKSRFLKLVDDNVELASNNGIKMALESFCYPPFIFHGLHDLTEFISGFPSSRLGILLEVGHLFHAGFNLNEAIRKFGKRLSDVHIHDATLGGDVRKATHLPIGSGSIDFRGLIAALRKVRYDGWLTLEIHGTERNIIENRAYLENLIKK